MKDRTLSFRKNTAIVFFSVAISFLFVALISYAATTISTNINTGGTLTVSGASTLNGNVTLGDLAADVILSTGGMQASSTLLVGDVARFYETAVLANSGSATTAVEGGIYYDSTSKVIKMYDGSAWFTVGTTTSGLSFLSPRVQLGDLSYYMTFGTTTQQGLSVLTLEATSTAAIPLTIVGRASQSANLFQVADAGASNWFSIGSGGTTTVTTGAVIGGGYSAGGTGATINSLGRVELNGDLAINGKATTTSAGAITTEGALTVKGAASSTSLVVGGDSVNGTLSGIVSGYCNITASVTITATSTIAATCAAANGIRAGDRVFVNATSSLPATLAVVSASSTAANTIGLYIANINGGANVGTGAISLWFLGIR